MRALAYYLPQFHPIPENNAWWGEGFTEWTNVARAKPQYRGHDQPRLPTDLGHYDLRLPEVMEQQAALGRAHGLEAFTCWHYWFGGKRLLERPVDKVLANEAIDFPFNLAWANEPWSRRWLGDDSQVLQEQPYSGEDDLAHARWLTSAFADPRYTKVNGRPLFSIYNPTALPAPARTVGTIRQVCSEHGLPDPYLVGINGRSPMTDMTTLGFDSTLDFQPQLGSLPYALQDGRVLRRLVTNIKAGVPRSRLKVYGDRQARDHMARSRAAAASHRSVFVGWDNTPRRGTDGIIIKDWSPEVFRSAVQEAASATAARHSGDEQLLWINAWNEWAEGNYLEPDQSHGHLKLQALRDALHA